MIADQLPRLLGVPTSGGQFVDDVGDLAGHLGEIDPPTAALGIGCLVVVLVLLARRTGIPGILVAVAGAAILVSVLDLDVASSERFPAACRP